MEKRQPRRLAGYNRAVVLDLVRRCGPITRTELASRSGLAMSSVVNVLGALRRRGLIKDVALGRSTGGRPPVLVELNASARYAIGATVRVTGVEAVLLDLTGNIVVGTSLPLQGGLSPSAVAGAVVEGVDQVLRLAAVDPGRVLGLGVGFPGPVRDGRNVLGAPWFPLWRDEPLAQEVEGLLGFPVEIENDANLAALAEYRHGIGRRTKGAGSLVYVYVDRGIGSGIVVEGKIWRGTDGVAGEVGHMIVETDGAPCACGSFGCLEASASIASVIRRALETTRAGGAGPLSSAEASAVSYPAVLEAIAAGDAVASSALDEALGYLSIGLANIDRQLRPACIVLGGEMFADQHEVFERLVEIRRRRQPFFGVEPAPVLLGELGSQAVCIGAATLVLEAFFGTPEHVISAERRTGNTEPAFERTPVWPHQELRC